MATNDKKIVSVLQRNGTDQLDRTDAALNPDSVLLHGFTMKDWMRFTARFAKKINYFGPEDDQQAQGTWEKFFQLETEQELQEMLLKVKESPNGNLTPHLTLFACFLQLLELSAAHLNGLTKRHLDFYYRDILQIDTLPAVGDKAYILFELAKNIADQAIEPGTQLDGGKDAIGKKRLYAVEEQLIASKTTVAQLRNVYNEHLIREEEGLDDEDRYAIKAAPVANSADGIGGELPEESPTWYPFGYYTHTRANLSDPMQEELPGKPELPAARLGFAIASPVLNLSEGERIVTVKCSFLNPVEPDPLPTTEDLADALDVYFTGAEGWLGPYPLSELITSGVSETRISGSDLILTVRLDRDQLAVTGYVPAVHGEQFDTTAPVARFLVKADTKARYTVYSTFAGDTNLLQNVTVTVDVKGMKTLVLESDTGTLNADKPFYPFSTNPANGSCFSFFNAEAFSKKWSKINFSLKWRNTPVSFDSHYAAYEKSFLGTMSRQKYTNAFDGYDYQVLDNNVASLYQGFAQYQATEGWQLQPLFYSPPQTNFNAIVPNNSYFKADVRVLHKEVWNNALDNIVLFNQNGDGSFDTRFEVSGTPYEAGKAGPVRMVLQQSFLHELYPRLYAMAISSTIATTLIPNEPYTPFAESPTLDYVASDTVNVASLLETVFNARGTQFFHEHPFGQSEENAYLKKVAEEKSRDCSVFPTYCKGGSLFIGLDKAQPYELVTLLIKLADGTENPLAKTFEDGQKVHWDILCNNVWKSLDDALMITNETDNFLRSGRVQFTIPPYATTDNTLLPTGLYWLRASMRKRYDAVCQVLGIHSQVALAQFEDNGNDLSHLANGLPAGSISKLVERISPVKSIRQPYATFGGVPAESDALYYRRVSERLRHKNRAQTLWDYEHLVLQQFPDVYKVKCLNHTCSEKFASPGNVTIVVIPDTINKTVFDIYQPRVSRGQLNSIQEYLSELNSMHISLDVINPEYEEVMVSLGAKFYKGIDDNYGKRLLEQDIMKYLSPWAFEQAREITFGVTLHRSALIHYIEQLAYVDYVEDVKIFKNEVPQQANCEPSTPKSILVSARSHVIYPATKTCKAITPVTEETCQL